MMGMFDETTPTGWTVPLGYVADFQNPPAKCRSCHAEVLWTTTPAGKRSPLDRDGKSHFATCPQAKEWRRPSAKARPSR